MRLIDADALIKKKREKDLSIGVEDVIGAPTIDAKPVIHAKWLPVNTASPRWRCSNCGYSMFCVPDWIGNYCSNCGAKMDLEDGE